MIIYIKNRLNFNSNMTKEPRNNFIPSDKSPVDYLFEYSNKYNKLNTAWSMSGFELGTGALEKVGPKNTNKFLRVGGSALKWGATGVAEFMLPGVNFLYLNPITVKYATKFTSTALTPVTFGAKTFLGANTYNYLAKIAPTSLDDTTKFGLKYYGEASSLFNEYFKKPSNETLKEASEALSKYIATTARNNPKAVDQVSKEFIEKIGKEASKEAKEDAAKYFSQRYGKATLVGNVLEHGIVEGYKNHKAIKSSSSQISKEISEQVVKSAAEVVEASKSIKNVSNAGKLSNLTKKTSNLIVSQGFKDSSKSAINVMSNVWQEGSKEAVEVVAKEVAEQTVKSSTKTLAKTGLKVAAKGTLAFFRGIPLVGAVVELGYTGVMTTYKAVKGDETWKDELVVGVMSSAGALVGFGAAEVVRAGARKFTGLDGASTSLIEDAYSLGEVVYDISKDPKSSSEALTSNVKESVQQHAKEIASREDLINSSKVVKNSTNSLNDIKNDKDLQEIIENVNLLNDDELTASADNFDNMFKSANFRTV